MSKCRPQKVSLGACAPIAPRRYATADNDIGYIHFAKPGHH